MVVKHSKRTRITQARFKRYGAVFACLTPRAVHLDLLGDLITDSFLLALIRGSWQEEESQKQSGLTITKFHKRRKRSFHIIERSKTKIENSLINKGVTWKFNPPSSL